MTAKGIAQLIRARIRARKAVLDLIGIGNDPAREIMFEIRDDEANEILEEIEKKPKDQRK